MSQFWLPKTFQKQVAVFDNKAHALLVSGPRYSGKTRAVLHKICRHLFDVDRARVCMFSRTLKNAKDGGTWSLLHRDIIPEWIKGNFGFNYTTDTNGVLGPKTDGLTRAPFFRIRNRFGTESEMILFSLDNDDDVEAKIKEMEASMIYFSELDKFGDRRVLTVALASLRIGKFEDQQWIADCNPSEEGEQSWIYQVFYRERLMSYSDFCVLRSREELPPLDENEFKEFYGQLDVIEILPAENVFADRRQLQIIKVACGADAGLYARHVEGKWVWGGGDASRHFRSSFKPHHIVGNVSSVREEDWETIVPSDQCFELITGWDLGEVNHAAHIIEKTYPQTPLAKAMRMSLPYFSVLDELVVIGKEISHEEFAQAFMEMIERLEALRGPGYQYNLERAWSDFSAIEKYSSTADAFPYMLVKAATEDRIILEGVPKAAGSVRTRVRLLKQLLNQNRIVVSAHCAKTIEMLRDLKKGKDDLNFVDERDKNKHAFDSLTYPLLMECADELRYDSNTPKAVRASIGYVQVS